MNIDWNYLLIALLALSQGVHLFIIGQLQRRIERLEQTHD